jgi:DNA-binding MarR family transcriptional regulator
MPGDRIYTGLLVRRAQQAHLALWQQLVSRDISSPQFGVLSELKLETGISQADLGAKLDLDKSTITDIVNRLDERGLITRTKDLTDRRKYQLQLTKLGESELRKLEPRVAQMDKSLTKPLQDDELDSLHHLLLKLLDGYEAGR